MAGHLVPAIGRFLSNYSYLNPLVLEIDRIVPLPLAKLPPWDGKVECLMAQAKGQDPETGRALPR